MRKTFLDLKNYPGIATAAGVCVSSDKFTGLTNEALERLSLAGDFWGTWRVVQMCLINGCITFTREVARLDTIRIGNHEPHPVEAPFTQWLDDSCGVHDHRWSHWTTEARFQNLVPTYADINPPGKVIRVYIDNPADAGKRILFQGYDDSNQYVLTAAGAVDGEYVTMVAQPGFAETAVNFSAITGVIKDVTLGNVRVYERSVATSALRSLAVYEPDETNPEYLRYNITGIHPTTNCPTQRVKALVKLEFIPVKKDTDWLLIGNLPALKREIESVRYAEMDSAGAKQLEAAAHVNAIRILNQELRTKLGRDNAAIKVLPMGRAHLRYQRVGLLT